VLVYVVSENPVANDLSCSLEIKSVLHV